MCYTTNVATKSKCVKGRQSMAVFKQTITDSEYLIMKILWETGEKIAVADVLEKLDASEWSASTVSTFLQRLLKKGVLACEKSGKTNLYYPILKQSEYEKSETDSFISKLYKGSAKNLVAALYENDKLSHDDIEELKRLFELE